MAYICTVCAAPEVQCLCPRYCSLCQSDFGVRLSEDGCYYCTECREICGYTAEERLGK